MNALRHASRQAQCQIVKPTIAELAACTHATGRDEHRIGHTYWHHVSLWLLMLMLMLMMMLMVCQKKKKTVGCLP